VACGYVLCGKKAADLFFLPLPSLRDGLAAEAPIVRRDLFDDHAGGLGVLAEDVLEHLGDVRNGRIGWIVGHLKLAQRNPNCEGICLVGGRIAKTRNLPEDRVRQLVVDNTEGRLFGLLGEPRVNVLQLNLALDHLAAG